MQGSLGKYLIWFFKHPENENVFFPLLPSYTPYIKIKKKGSKILITNTKCIYLSQSETAFSLQHLAEKTFGTQELNTVLHFHPHSFNTLLYQCHCMYFSALKNLHVIWYVSLCQCPLCCQGKTTLLHRCLVLVKASLLVNAEALLKISHRIKLQNNQ